jgi:hypothetical protein
MIPQNHVKVMIVVIGIMKMKMRKLIIVNLMVLQPVYGIVMEFVNL